jgi:hypothetical protein
MWHGIVPGWVGEDSLILWMLYPFEKRKDMIDTCGFSDG